MGTKRQLSSDIVLPALGCAVAVAVGWYASTFHWKPAAAGAIGVIALIAALLYDRWMTLVVLPLALLIPPSFRVPVGGLPDLTPMRLVIALAMLGAVTVLLDKDATGYRRFPVTPWWAASGFTIYVVGISASGGMSEISRGISYSAEALAPVWLLWVYASKRDDALQFVDLLIVIIAIAAMLGLYEQATQHFLLPEKDPYFFHAPERSGGIRIQGVFPHPLVFATVLTLMIPVAIARALTLPDSARRYLIAGCIPVYGAALLFTESRGPWLATVAALVLMAGLATGRERFSIVFGLMSAALVVVFSPVHGKVAEILRGLIDPSSGQAAGAYTVQYRKVLLDFTQQYASHHLTGAGPGKADTLSFFAIVGGGVTDLAQSIDNAYAKYALEIGPIGLALFLAVIAVAMAASWRAREVRDPQLSLLATAIFATQAGMLVTSFTVATFTWAQLSALFWLLSALTILIAFRRIEPLEREAKRIVQPTRAISQTTERALDYLFG